MTHLRAGRRCSWSRWPSSSSATPGARRNSRSRVRARGTAAGEFTPEALTPTYRLTIGLPGGSQAFAIAERLGLPGTLVADARSRLTGSQRAFEATLAKIRDTERAVADAPERGRLPRA